MKRFVTLFSLCVAVSIMLGCTTSALRNVADDSVLKGVRTVYIEPSIEFYMQRAFARQLPQVRVVANEKDADIVLYFNSRAGGVSVGDPSTSPGHSTGIAMRPDGRSIVIHEGPSGDLSMNEFVSDFINAWRAANPATTSITRRSLPKSVLNDSGTVEAAPDSVSPEKILVVDDDGSILRLVATILRRERYHVDTATGGREALSKIELTPYDVIVLDLMMPEVSGLDVLRSLDVRFPRIKCVVILSAASSFDLAASHNPNVFAALRKPFDNAALIGAIRGCIEAKCPVAFPIGPVTAAA